MVGPLVERLPGNVGFAVVYLPSALGASLASMGWDPSVVSAGASGAVFGVNGALLGFLARADERMREADRLARELDAEYARWAK